MPNVLIGDQPHLVPALLACFFILLAHAGFALYETGLGRAKNASATMVMNATVWALCAIGFFICGFAFLCGGASGELRLDRWLIHIGRWNILAGKGFFLAGVSGNSAALLLFFFMLARLSITATIPSGALAERWRFKSFLIFSLLISGIVAPIFGSWVWGGGWIAQLPFGRGGMDYAGSAVIHLQGGAIALVAAWLLGARIGKFDAQGRPRPILGHHVPMALLGCLILAVALLALNCAASLVASDGLVMMVAVNSILAAAAGAIAACIYMSIAYGKPDPTMMGNGMLGGIVAIAASCAFVSPWTALFIGAIAGVLVVWSISFWERRGIDDPAGVVSVHGASGLWGILALGIFYGNHEQFLAQCITAVACIAWSVIVGGAAFQLVGRFFGPNRVPRDVELSGLDVPEFGVPAYREQASPVASETRIAEPRPAVSPVSMGGKRFSVVIEGVDPQTLIGAWSGLCQVGSQPPSQEFKEVYPFLTTVTGNRFRFSGGDPGRMKDNLGKLFTRVLPEKTVSARLES